MKIPNGCGWHGPSHLPAPCQYADHTIATVVGDDAGWEFRCGNKGREQVVFEGGPLPLPAGKEDRDVLDTIRSHAADANEFVTFARKQHVEWAERPKLSPRGAGAREAATLVDDQAPPACEADERVTERIGLHESRGLEAVGVERSALRKPFPHLAQRKATSFVANEPPDGRVRDPGVRLAMDDLLNVGR